MNTDYENKWLVKSDNKIVGPYSFDQIEDFLFKRQISLIDEVRDMNTRWLYIREVPEFKEMVEKVRIELDKRSEETRTIQTSTRYSDSQTGTNTLAAENENAELTTSPPAFTNISVDPQDITFQEVATTTSISDRKKNIGSHFVSTADPNIQKELQTSYKKYFIIFGVALFLAIGSGFSYQLYKKNSQEKIEQNLFKRMRKLALFGADQRAIEVYQKMPEALQLRILPEVIDLWPKLDAEGLINLDEIIQETERKKISAEQKVKIDLVKFNKKMALNNFSEAKGELINAKDLSPEYETVQENEAIINLIENQNKVSTNQFLKLFTGLNKGRFLLGAALNHLSRAEMSDVEMMEKIDRYLSTRIEYKKELLLVQIYLSLKNSNLKAADSFIAEFVNTPNLLSQQFKVPGLIFKSIYKIDKVIPYYEKIKNQLGAKNAGLIDLHIFLEKNDGYSAEKQYEKIKNLLSADEKNNTLIAIHSVLNRWSEAMAIEKSSPAGKLNLASQLSLLRMKRAHKIQDYSAQVNYLKKEKNLFSLWAELLNFSDNENEKIKSYLQLNAQSNDDFVPLIEMKAQIE